MSQLPALTAQTLDETIAGADRPVLLEVGAPWCPPCRALEPTLEALAADLADQLLVYRIDADDHPDVLGRFGIMGLPTMLVFRDGQLANRIVGARGRGRLLEDLADVLSPPVATTGSR